MSRVLRVGIFVMLGLACLLVGVFVIGRQDFKFKQTYTLKTEFPNAQGLIDGAEVRLGGIHEGTVKKIELPAQPGGKLTVEMKLDPATKNLIKKDSTAQIKTEGLLGDKYVEISFGSANAPAVESGDTIAGRVEQSVEDQASAVTSEAKKAVEAFRDNMQALQSNFLLRGFFEKRGYHDTSELTKDAVSHLPEKEPSKTFEFDAKDLFNSSDNAKLKNKGRLDDAGKYLQETQFSLAVIAASTNLGTSDKDRTLTRARAKVVRDYLVSKFSISDQHLKTIGLGKDKDSESEARVSIYVYGGESDGKQK